jgi:hypothetical protein
MSLWNIFAKLFVILKLLFVYLWHYDKSIQTGEICRNLKNRIEYEYSNRTKRYCKQMA